MDLFDSYTADDEAQFRKDSVVLPETSAQSLKRMAKATLLQQSNAPIRAREARLKSAWLEAASDPTHRVKRPLKTSFGSSKYLTEQLEASQRWLDMHKDELPKEITSSRGFVADDNFDHMDTPVDFQAAMFHVAGADCYQSLEETANRNGADKRLYDTYGPVRGVREYLLNRRGELHTQYEAKRELKVKWRGMPEYEGMSRGLELAEQGLRLTKHTAELPTAERLDELLSLQAGELTWKVSRGRVKAGASAMTTLKDGRTRVRIDGKAYDYDRIVSYMDSGVDLSSTSVRELVNTNAPSQWQARLRIADTEYSLGVYESQEVAEEAYRLGVKALRDASTQTPNECSGDSKAA